MGPKPNKMRHYLWTPDSDHFCSLQFTNELQYVRIWQNWIAEIRACKRSCVTTANNSIPYKQLKIIRNLKQFNKRCFETTTKIQERVETNGEIEMQKGVQVMKYEKRHTCLKKRVHDSGRTEPITIKVSHREYEWIGLARLGSCFPVVGR